MIRHRLVTSVSGHHWPEWAVQCDDCLAEVEPGKTRLRAVVNAAVAGVEVVDRGGVLVHLCRACLRLRHPGLETAGDKR